MRRRQKRSERRWSVRPLDTTRGEQGKCLGVLRGTYLISECRPVHINHFKILTNHTIVLGYHTRKKNDATLFCQPWERTFLGSCRVCIILSSVRVTIVKKLKQSTFCELRSGWKTWVFARRGWQSMLPLISIIIQQQHWVHSRPAQMCIANIQ